MRLSEYLLCINQLTALVPQSSLQTFLLVTSPQERGPGEQFVPYTIPRLGDQGNPREARAITVEDTGAVHHQGEQGGRNQHVSVIISISRHLVYIIDSSHLSHTEAYALGKMRRAFVLHRRGEVLYLTKLEPLLFLSQ